MYGTAPESIVDGPGLRFSVFVQGCSHHCPGCHNPESQPSQGGYLCETQQLVEEIKKNKLIHGVTLTGGEPFEQTEGMLELARELRAEGFNLWIYSGYLFEDLMQGNPHPKAPELLALCDVLVDGPFVQALSSYELKWKGSSNQRVINIPATLEKGEVVLWHDETLNFSVPASW
jgi:anaerobic ribonucleoside-triphosphate reductase activating protein